MSADARLVRQVRTHLNLAAHYLELAAVKTGEAGLVRKAGTLERLARETAQLLGDLPAEGR